jgi:hypothetical protein
MKDEPLLFTLNHDDLFGRIDEHHLSVERMQPGVGSVFGRKKADEKQSDNESRENSWGAHRSLSELRIRNKKGKSLERCCHLRKLGLASFLFSGSEFSAALPERGVPRLRDRRLSPLR